MAALTQKQQAFVDAYTGNGMEAARAAGYAGNPKALAVTACELLKLPHVLAAIASRRSLSEQMRQDAAQAGSIASRVERQAFWTATMRDVGQDIGVRLKASELLGRSEVDFTDKLAVEARVTLEDLLRQAGDKAGA